MYIKTIILLSIFIIINPIRAKDYENLRMYFPESNTFIAETWTLGIDSKVDVISKKIVQAIKDNPLWIQSYIKDLNLAPGKIMPYHSNFAVSKKEYKLFIDSIQNMKLIKTGEISVSVKELDKELLVEFRNTNLPIDSFKIDTFNNRAITNHANLEKFSKITQSEIQNPIGLWSGIQWKHEEVNTFRELIAIGEMKNEKAGIIYYDLKSSKLGSTYFIIKFAK